MAAVFSPKAILSGKQSSVCCSRDLQETVLRRRFSVCPGRPRYTCAALGSEFVRVSEKRRRLFRRASLGIHGGDYCVRFRRRQVGLVRSGLPVISSVPVLGPVLNAFFNPVVLFIIYAAGASRFWGGFGRTTYNNTAPTKITLTALWPALFVVSAAYRSNFKKAVQ